jgi:tripartite-type tricarboxylate transporter receptor subunit TctC
MRQKLFLQGWQVVGSTAEELASRVKVDTAQLGQIITSQGIKAE